MVLILTFKNHELYFNTEKTIIECLGFCYSISCFLEIARDFAVFLFTSPVHRSDDDPIRIVD